MISRTFTFAELHKSHLNVRTNAEDSEATEALEVSIDRFGLMHPLTVHPVGDKGSTPWGVYAGGRRLRAIGRLIEAGKLPADWPIPVTIDDRPDAEITELSLSENLLRRALRPHEVHAAIATAFAQGDSVEKIASTIGQREQWVRQQLRLGTLAAPILEAYVEERLSYDQACAYAATADTVLQLQVYEAHLHLPFREHNPTRIRAALKVGDREAGRLLLFVGEAVYVGKGGMCEPDLFADGPDARVRIHDEALLRRLAEERFSIERERIRRDAKRPDLRFVTQPPQYAGQVDKSLEISADAGKLPAGDVVATIDVNDHGQPIARYWWANRTAKGAAERGETRVAAPRIDTPTAKTARAGEALTMPNSDFSKSAHTIAKDDYGLSSEGVQLFRSLRRSLLRALLVRQGGSVARDYLIWAQARSLFRNIPSSMTGLRPIIDEFRDGDRGAGPMYADFASDVIAERDWLVDVAALKAQSFMIEDDPAVSLQIFLDLDIVEKDHVAAIVAGEALVRSADTPGWRIAAHDVVAKACGANAKLLRNWWTPTSRWLGQFGRLFRLATVQQFVDAATHTAFIQLKDPDLTAATLTALEADRHTDPGVRARAERWLPDLIAFGPDEGAPLVEALRLDEPSADEESRVKVKASLRAKADKLRQAEQRKVPAE